MLLYNGWITLSEDDKTTRDIYESSYYKGSQLLMLYVQFNFNEVWITVSDVKQRI